MTPGRKSLEVVEMKKVWIILRSRIDLEGDTALVETEDEVCLHPSGEPFFGSWTDDAKEFENDESIQLLVRSVEDLSFNSPRVLLQRGR